MARGYPGAFGRKVNSPLVWITLTLLFVVPFVDRRRLLRMRHLDLAVLVAFGVSVAFFNDANIDVSVPLAYPLLVYLLVAHAVDRAAAQPSAAIRCACSCRRRGSSSGCCSSSAFASGSTSRTPT